MKNKLTLLFLIFSSTFFAQKIGDKIEVLWNDAYYPAIIKNVNEKDKKWLISYENYSESWDEWIGLDRIKTLYSKGEKIEVNWNGTWFEATILEIKDNKYKISYTGYDSNWDEWVELNRMKKLTKK